MGNEGKKVTSTARKLKFMWVAKLTSKFLVFDIVMCLALFVTCIYCMEKYSLGEFRFDAVRSLYTEGNERIYEVSLSSNSDKAVQLVYDNITHEYRYRVLEKQEIIENNKLDLLIKIIQNICTLLFLVQIIMIISEMFGGIKSIRRKLQPLNELAETTNRLTNIAMNDNKFHDLENAILQIAPDGPNGILSTSDEDLKGLENAINQLLERMRESYKQQSRFVSDASHELRTPIAVIQGYVNMLDRWGKEDETILNESIEAIKNESEHMKKLVEQLLFLARGDSGRNQINFEKVSLYDLMKEVYEESIMIDEQHVYEFEGEQNIFVNADGSMLKQTMRILTDNASKYSYEKATILLKCGLKNDKAYFFVQDNGIGMNENDAAHIFERFYRSDVARDKKTGGTGLGLSIAKWIVDRHHGYFEVLSRQDIGTRITVIMPRIG